MKYFSMLIKPASSFCNLQCTYCFYHDLSSQRLIPCYDMMEDKVIRSIVEKTVGYFQEEVHLSYAFQGGEPTCVGLDYYRKFVAIVEEYKKAHHHIHYSIQTNGTLLDKEWIKFFKEHHFLVGISIDGFKDNHDTFRKGRDGQGSFQRVIESYKLLKEYDVDVNVLTVLTSSLSQSPMELYAFYQKEDIDYIQLIPCFSEWDKDNEEALKPEEFSSFYKVFFELWLKEYKENIHRSISFFDNIILLFSGKLSMQCGYLGFCSMQTVVEADGSVYPCDFYVLDHYKIGNIQEMTLVELMQSEKTIQFLKEPNNGSPRCQNCKHIDMCHGNCKRFASVYYNNDYCALEDFMNTKENELKWIARQK